jgi:hypothetical protein
MVHDGSRTHVLGQGGSYACSIQVGNTDKEKGLGDLDVDGRKLLNRI